MTAEPGRRPGRAPAQEEAPSGLDGLEPPVARDLPVPHSPSEGRAAPSGASAAGANVAADGGPVVAAAGAWASPSPRPYLVAIGVGVAAMLVLIAVAGLPAAAVFQIGLTFLAVAMVVRRFEDIPEDTDNPVLGWLYDRVVQLEGKFGVEFYGIAALTSFLRSEVDLVDDLAVGDLLANPVGAAISWFISALIESVVNAFWASLWWLQLLQATDGLYVFVGIVMAGWLVWRVLEITPPDGGAEEGPEIDPTQR